MDTFAVPNQAPIRPLRWRPIRQSWEPSQRCRDSSAVGKVQGQSIAADRNVLRDCFTRLRCRSTHATLSAEELRFLPRLPVSVEVLTGQIRGCSPAGPDPARTWRHLRHAPRVRGVVRLDPLSKRRTGMVRTEELLATTECSNSRPRVAPDSASSRFEPLSQRGSPLHHRLTTVTLAAPDLAGFATLTARTVTVAGDGMRAGAM